MLLGYRIAICSDDHTESKLPEHYTGGTSTTPCPNCGQLFFPVFNIDCTSDICKKLDIWELQRFIAYVCPACALYMDPYWIQYDGDSVVDVIGGYREDASKIQNIETPYSVRSITLSEIDTEVYLSTEVNDLYSNRKAENGVYHQLGGIPITQLPDSMICPRCSNVMDYAGIIDYDDLNVPLYEDNHRPVALIIGDLDSIYLYTCKQCSIIGYRWVY